MPASSTVREGWRTFRTELPSAVPVRSGVTAAVVGAVTSVAAAALAMVLLGEDGARPLVSALLVGLGIGVGVASLVLVRRTARVPRPRSDDRTPTRRRARTPIEWDSRGRVVTALLSATPPPILPADRGRILDATASVIRASTVDVIARIVGVIAWLVGVTGVVLASTENDALLVFAAVANVALAVVELVLIGASVRRLGRVAALQRIAEGLPVEDLDGEHLPVE